MRIFPKIFSRSKVSKDTNLSPLTDKTNADTCAETDTTAGNTEIFGEELKLANENFCKYMQSVRFPTNLPQYSLYSEFDEPARKPMQRFIFHDNGFPINFYNPWTANEMFSGFTGVPSYTPVKTNNKQYAEIVDKIFAACNTLGKSGFNIFWAKDASYVIQYDGITIGTLPCAGAVVFSVISLTGFVEMYLPGMQEEDINKAAAIIVEICDAFDVEHNNKKLLEKKLKILAESGGLVHDDIIA